MAPRNDRGRGGKNRDQDVKPTGVAEIDEALKKAASSPSPAPKSGATSRSSGTTPPSAGSAEGLLTHGVTREFGNSSVPPIGGESQKPAAGNKDAKSDIPEIPQAENFSGEVTPPRVAPAKTSATPTEPKVDVNDNKPLSNKTPVSKQPAPKPDAYDQKTVTPKPNAFEQKTILPDDTAPAPTAGVRSAADKKPAVNPPSKAKAYEQRTIVPQPDVFEQKTVVPDSKPEPAKDAPQSEATPATKPAPAAPAAAAAVPPLHTAQSSAPLAAAGTTTPVTAPAPATTTAVSNPVRPVTPEQKVAAALPQVQQPSQAEMNRWAESFADSTDDDRSDSNRQIRISEKTMEKVVAAAVRSVPGTITRNAGIDVITGRSLPRYDIKLDDEGDAIAIDAHIAVGWPAPVAKVAEKTREAIIAWVGDMTDVPVVHANVRVAHVEPGHERVTVAQLESLNVHPTLTPVRVTHDRPHVPIVTKDWSITPTVISGNTADQVRSIPVPAPATIRPFSAGVEPTVVSPTVTGNTPEVPIRVADQVELAPITVAEPVELTPITTKPQPTVKPVLVPKPQPLAAITVAPETPLKPVSQAHTMKSVAVNVARERPLKKVMTPPPAQVASVPLPSSHRLRDVNQPNPVRLKEIAVAKSPTPQTPSAKPLRIAQISAPDGHKVAHPKQPRSARLKKVTTTPVEVVSVPLPQDRAVYVPEVPADRPLKPITLTTPRFSTRKAVK